MPSCCAFTAPSPTHASRAKPCRRARPAVCCAAGPSQPAEIPTSVDATLALASRSLSETLATGTKRAKVSAVIPGLNPLIEDTVPYSDALLNTIAYGLARTCPDLSKQPSVSLLFKSAGTAAAALAALRPPEDGPVSFASYFRRDGSSTKARASQHANIVINPTSARGDRIMDDLETVIEEAPEAVWVLLNPDLGQDRAAVGMREIGRRNDFLESFANAFYFRNLFEIRRPQLIAEERGALLYTYPGPWHVYALTGGSYVLSEDFVDMPGAEPITSCVRKTIAVASAPARKQRTQAMDAQYFQVLAFCAVVLVAMYVALVVIPPSPSSSFP